MQISDMGFTLIIRGLLSSSDASGLCDQTTFPLVITMLREQIKVQEMPESWV